MTFLLLRSPPQKIVIEHRANFIKMKSFVLLYVYLLYVFTIPDEALY